MTVLTVNATTERIALEEIERRVLERSGRRVRDLRVSVHRGQIVLQGRTDTYYGKQLAQHGALELVPEGRLENAIDVF
jgi:hypothetical protein